MSHQPLPARVAWGIVALLMAACDVHRAGDPCSGSEAPVCETVITRLSCEQGRWVSESCALPRGCVPQGDVISCTVVDGGTPLDAGARDAGHPSSTVYPAPHPAYPEAITSGGTVLVAPQAQVITFANDTPDYVQAAEIFTAKVGATSFWSDIGKEYGVGPLVAALPVRLSEAAPAVIDYDGVERWLAGKLDAGAPGFERPDGGTVYTVVFPRSTAVGQGCDALVGYHMSLTFKGAEVPYAVIARCPWPGTSDLDAFTSTLSHELIEAATDPYPLATPAYFDVDTDHAAWSLMLYGEVSDLCTLEPDWLVVPNGLPYGAQRSWSNAAARAGRNPCVPAPPGEVYFAAAPELNDRVPYTTSTGVSGVTQGVRILPGDTRSIRVRLFSEAPTDDWGVSASGLVNGALSFSFDRAKGNNGDVLTLSITVNFANPQNGAGLFWVSATRAGSTAEHRYYGLVAQ